MTGNISLYTDSDDKLEVLEKGGNSGFRLFFRWK